MLIYWLTEKSFAFFVPKKHIEKSTIASLFFLSFFHNYIMHNLKKDENIPNKAFLDRKEGCHSDFFSLSYQALVIGQALIIFFFLNQRNLENGKGEQAEGLNIPDR